MVDDQPELILPDVGAWRRWLAACHATMPDAWLVLAKKGTSHPTSLTYDEALEEALCQGWIDGHVRRRDATTYRQRFTPRRAHSTWSRRNVAIIERLDGEGRMQPAGRAAVATARADGRWEAAYAGPADITVPEDLAAALAAHPSAEAMFALLTSQNRYALLRRVEAAKRQDTRARRVRQFVEMLEREETIYPQRRALRAMKEVSVVDA